MDKPATKPNKGKNMTLWAVVIGKVRPYVAYAEGAWPLLAVYETHRVARVARRRCMRAYGYKEVHIRKFVPAAKPNKGKS